MRGQKPATPQNLAARALRETLFRQRKVKNAKTYSRKVKHKKGERDIVGVPLFAYVAV